MSLRTVIATRYVTLLRESGSLPAIIEAEQGAGQGPRALVAELVAGEMARAARLPVPEIVFVDLDDTLARTPRWLPSQRAGFRLALRVAGMTGSGGYRQASFPPK